MSLYEGTHDYNHRMWSLKDKPWNPFPTNKDSVGIVALDVPLLPDTKRIEESLCDDSIGLPHPIHLSSRLEEGGSCLDISTGFFEAVAVLVDTPAPCPEIEWACDGAAWWPDAWAMLRSHMAHVAITLTRGRGTALEKNIVLTKITAAVAESVDAIGIYWKSGRVVQSVSDFGEYSRNASLDNLPVNLWVHFGLFDFPGSHRQLFTIGMESLGHHEIEIGSRSLTFDDLQDLAWWVAYQVLLGDADVKSGDVFTDENGHEYIARFEDSIWNRPGKVMRLDLKDS